MNKQRTEIYSFRNEVLHTQNTLILADEILEVVCREMCHTFFSNRTVEGGWNPEGYRKWLMTHFPVTFEVGEFDNDYLQVADIEQKSSGKVTSAFKTKLEHDVQMIEKAQAILPPSRTPMTAEQVLFEVVRNLLIRNIDRLWQDHLLHIDHLRAEIHLRSIGQKDPLLEFKHEAFNMFETLSLKIKLEIAHALFKFAMILPEQEEPPPPPVRPVPMHRTNLSLLPE
jgi:preprotein translocase subunit SecA